jgi:hypothetical protein
MKPEAQFMRWSAGAGAEATFMPFQGSLFDKRDKTMGQRLKRAAKAAQFGVKANAEASFAVGEAKMEAILYLPHAAGWHLDPSVAGQALDFGYFRLRGDLTLSALAGASVALEADAALMVTGDKQGIKGTPRNQAGAKAKVGAKGEAKVFAGLKEAIDLVGALQWLNPEGLIDPNSPKKADASGAIAAYADVASVSVGVHLIQGLAATLGFECDYRNGNFVIAAKASGCLGLGGGYNLGCEVKGEHIGQFLMCIAHQLKQADYKKIGGLMQEKAFNTLNKILFLVVAKNLELRSFIGREADEITRIYYSFVSSTQQSGEQAIQELAQRLRTGWGWYSYLPPESRGAVIRTIVDVLHQPQNRGNGELRGLGAFSISELIATTQSVGHLNNTLDRITLALGEEPGRNQGMQLISSVLSETMFEGCVDRCTASLEKASPLKGRPFLRSDEPEIRLAQLPLHHPGYTA